MPPYPASVHLGIEIDVTLDDWRENKDQTRHAPPRLGSYRSGAQRGFLFTVADVACGQPRPRATGARVLGCSLDRGFGPLALAGPVAGSAFEKMAETQRLSVFLVLFLDRWVPAERGARSPAHGKFSFPLDHGGHRVSF